MSRVPGSFRALALRAALTFAVAVLLCLLVLPLLGLLVHLPPMTLVGRLREPMVLDALRLSAVTSLAATTLVVVLGLPVAYLLATREFRGKRVVETLVELPIVLPPTVAGVGLLLAFGRSGLAGGALKLVGITLPFTTLAVVIAQLFVSTPFFISAAAAGFASVDKRYLEVAATLRAPPAYRFFRVLLPLALPSVLAGAAMSWARSLGEFGATITFAGNLAGRTQTMPLAVYAALQTDLDAAVALSVLLVILSFTVLIGLRLLPWAANTRLPLGLGVPVAGTREGSEMLRVDVTKRLGSFACELSLQVAPGETLVVVGESGAGKSTLLRLVAGLERPDRGRITVGETDWFAGVAAADVPPWRRSIGYVSQDYALFPHLSVFENVAFGLRADGRPSGEVQDRATGALARLGITDLASRRPLELSGGQQQRVALARALALKPDVLLLDEPLLALDLRTRQAVRGELKRLLAELPCVTLYVTHHPIEAMVFGDRIAALEGGRVTQVGTREDLLRRPRSRYIAAFLGINLFFGSIAGRANGVARIRSEHGDLSVVDPGGNEDVVAVVNPRDISLFRDAPGGSAQNAFAGVITELIPEPPNGERVRVVLNTNPPLVAEVTDHAVERLGLREGLHVHATFKATGVEVFR